ncbi:MAG: hypothetical protein D3924_18355 [Candidatus Electrothrix sp. AR4]|nr:hypothetical protein [Candidatus Electrothrix sp. AR4]
MHPEIGKGRENDDDWKALVHDASEERKDELSWHNTTHKDAQQVFCVWYSPWQHQNESNPLIPLVKEIQAQFSTFIRWKKKGEKINRCGGLAVAKLLEHLADAAASMYLRKNINVARGVTDAVRQGWQEAAPDLTTLSDGQRFHLLFEDAVTEVLKSVTEKDKLDETKARLVIFIDDLDRCEEGVVVRLLEAIKLYLGSQRCLFILGLDDNAVMEALKRHWNRAEDANREYLEKLFQATLSVPLPTSEGIREHIYGQLQNHEIPSFGNIKVCADIRENMAKDIEQLLEPNPRKIKNFINGLCATWNMLNASQWIMGEKHEKYKEQARQFIVFHYLRQYHRSIWRLLERQPETLKLLRAVLTHAAPLEPLEFEHINGEAQRLLTEFFSRSFSHVLGRREEGDRYSRDDDPFHGSQDIEAAIQAFQERQDRKRSDEHFRKLFADLIPPQMSLPQKYLVVR